MESELEAETDILYRFVTVFRAFAFVIVSPAVFFCSSLSLSSHIYLHTYIKILIYIHTYMPTHIHSGCLLLSFVIS